MRRSSTLAGVTASALLTVAACGHRSNDGTTHPADAPPRWLEASSRPGSVLSLYEGYDAVGVHEVDDEHGWRSRYVELSKPARDLAVLDESRWVVTHDSGELVLVDGSDAPKVVATLDPGPLEVASGDLDRDGTMDLVVASFGERQLLQVFLGTDDGFAAPRFVPLDPKGRQPPALTLVDLDGEGTLDVVTGLTSGGRADPVPDHLRVFRNTTHGKLTDEWVALVPSPTRVHAGDLDGDGLPDVLATGPEGAWLHISSGYGWLNTPRKISRGSFCDGELRDLDRDGKLDVVLLRTDEARIELRYGVGAGRLAPVQRFDVGAGPIALAVVERDDATLLVSANAEDRSFTTVRASRSGFRRTDR